MPPVKLRIEEGRFNSLFDFAIAEIEDEDIFINSVGSAIDDPKSILPIPYSLNELMNHPVIDVTMYGTISGNPSSTTRQVKSSIPDRDSNVIFNNVVLADAVSQPGDSGAPVIDNSGKLVGYILGKDESQNVTVIMPLHNIIQHTSFKIKKIK